MYSDPILFSSSHSRVLCTSLVNYCRGAQQERSKVKSPQLFPLTVGSSTHSEATRVVSLLPLGFFSLPLSGTCNKGAWEMDFPMQVLGPASPPWCIPHHHQLAPHLFSELWWQRTHSFLSAQQAGPTNETKDEIKAGVGKTAGKASGKEKSRAFTASAMTTKQPHEWEGWVRLGKVNLLGVAKRRWGTKSMEHRQGSCQGSFSVLW